MTATLRKGAASDTKQWSLNISALPLQDVDAVALAEAQVALLYQDGSSVNRANVTKDLTLLDTGMHGTQITWTSTNNGVIDPATGNVFRPNLLGNQAVRLTATRKNAAQRVKHFDLEVTFGYCNGSSRLIARTKAF